MNRALFVPASIALSAHAVFLLGFNRSPVARSHVEEAAIAITPVLPAIVEEPPPENTNLPSGADSAPPRPTLPEPPPVAAPPNAITIHAESQPVRPLVNAAPLPVIPLLPSGFGNGDGSGPGVSIIDARLLDDTPRAVAQSEPPYPYDLKSQGIGGSVRVVFVVDKAGRVVSAEAVDSSNPGFNEAAVSAVRRWRFAPGKRNGAAVSFRMSVTVAFSIHDQ